ncbi:MAG: carbohydrate-binding domain-containing protein [Oscillospiraceae bacterium]|nr:carbohydrate-binding domain-containing protein [Oscillospiraceae bacterium]
MKKNRLAVTAAVLLLAASVLLSACGITGSDNNTQSAENSAKTSASTDAGKGSSGTTASPAKQNAQAETASYSSGEESELFTERDLAQEADTDDAETITVSDGAAITITEAGVYILTGSAEEACVTVDAEDDAKVQFVLDGVSIVNSEQPCILVENADKVFLTSAEGSENVFAVSGSFAGDEDAAVFSRDDLVLNGQGTVTVSSSEDGIRTNDDLKLTGGAWYVSASGSALKAHDSILADGGEYFITAGSDGLHAEDNDDDTFGSIVIEGGTFDIDAGDDGVHATTTATVNDGTLTIDAAEGIEATQVILNGGTVTVRATDDGVNAGRKSNALSVKIEINGGIITVVMGSGDTDAVDSNGDLVITGGTIDITAQSPFDYDGGCTYTGGTIIVNGSQTNSVTNQMMGGRGGFGGGRPM